MINKHFVLKFPDSHNQFVRVDTKGKPVRVTNVNMMTFWQEVTHCKSYASIYKEFNFVVMEVEFNLYEVL